jgi:hypothetical protein
MAEEKRKKKRGKRERKERRFAGNQNAAAPIAVGAGMLGGLALGAGVYAQWVSENSPSYAPFILAGGAFTLGASMFFGDAQAETLRVGDVGVALEKKGELLRFLWCDITRVAMEGQKLVLTSNSANISVPVRNQKAAVAWILAEGTRRIPDVMDVKRDAIAGLPEPSDKDGELVAVEGFQVTGRHCAKSGKPIAFERDARLCPQCAQVYHHTSVPKRCMTCQAELGEKALEV